MRDECCKKCNSLKELWWFEGSVKKFGHCCVMLLHEGVVMKINEPEKDMCEMFEEVQELLKAEKKKDKTERIVSPQQFQILCESAEELPPEFETTIAGITFKLSKVEDK